MLHSLSHRLNAFTLMVALAISTQGYTQLQTIVSTSHILLRGDAEITNNGCKYEAAIVNVTDDYVLCPSSVFKAKVRYRSWSSSSEKWRNRSTTKRIRFKEVMLEPNSRLSKEGRSSDTDTRQYTSVTRLAGEFKGSSFVAPNDSISDYGTVELTHDTAEYVVLENEHLIVRARLGKSGFTAMTGCAFYPVHFEIESKDTLVTKMEEPLKIHLFYQGMEYDFEHKVRKLKPGKTKKFKQNFDGCQFNFEPRVFVLLEPLTEPIVTL